MNDLRRRAVRAAKLLDDLLTRRGIDGSYRPLEPALRKVMGMPA